MNALEFLKSIWPEPVFLTTATTGVSPANNEIIAAGIKTIHGVTTVYKSVDTEKLLPSVAFHKITPEWLALKVSNDEDWVALRDALKGKTVLSYNPEFHKAFLASAGILVDIEDLPLIMKGLEMRIWFNTEDIRNLTELCAFYREYGIRPPGFKRLCDKYGILIDDDVMTPMEANLKALEELYGKCGELCVTC